MARFLQLALIFLLAAPAYGAVGFDKAAQSGASTSKTVAITPAGTAEALFCETFTSGAAATVVADNKNTGNYTAVAASSETNGSTTVEWWYHLGAVSASATTVTMTTTSSNNSIICYALTGVPTSGTIINSVEVNKGTPTALSTTSLSVANSGSGLLFGAGDITASSTTYIVTAGSSWTTSTNENATFFPAGSEHQMNVASGTSTVTATSENSGTAWAGASICINPVISATATMPPAVY